ncbi:hypothetical protein [Aromatoleum petrolei]|uniref:Secreted protein n=1 Tax=Aromatoleum petrolei TaxID=76116 RepID=A0ABX1MM83_9RHOO|nr:hypothetical protein [Aromatoleum petrolei]NMF88270.1 hypothetical protein [Aromatoleum petrolei]
MKTIALVVGAILSLLSGIAFGATREDECATGVFEILRRDIPISKLSLRSDGSNVVADACKTWPYKPNLVLVAVAYDEGVEYEKSLIVAVIDKKTKRVGSSSKRAIYEDATTEVGERSLRLDTAKYQLANDVRAFGVRFNSAARGASCGEAYWNDELTLLVPEGKDLRPLASLNLYQQRWLEGCPAATSSALWEDATLTVGMANARTNGLFDLVITARITVNSMGAATGNLKDRIEQHSLHYDGRSYQKGKPVPWWPAI